jgi:hypothetical protein
VPLPVQAARAWMFWASSGIERGKPAGLVLVRGAPMSRLAHAWHGHPDDVAALAGFPALAAGGMLVWVEGESPDHHNVSHETLGGATEWPLLVACDPRRDPAGTLEPTGLPARPAAAGSGAGPWAGAG